jgi:ribosomal protein S15P/S13E
MTLSYKKMDTTELTLFLSVVVATIGTILGFYYFNRTNKSDRAVLAREKSKEEVILAKELRVEHKNQTLEFKQQIIAEFSLLLDKLKSDLEIQKMNLISEIGMMKRDDKDLRRDLENALNLQQTVNDRMQKTIEFMSQFLWGAGAKSDPAYLSGQVETQEHLNEPPVGMFKSPDSSETQKTKDDKKKNTGEEQS